MYPHCRVSRTERRAPVRRGDTFYIYSLRDCSLITYRGRAVKSICHRGIKHKQRQRIYRRPRYRCTRRIRIILDTLMLRARALFILFSQSICFARQQVTALSLGQWFAVRHDFLFDRDFVPWRRTPRRREPSIPDPPPAVTGSPEKETARRLPFTKFRGCRVGFSSRPVFAERTRPRLRSNGSRSVRNYTNNARVRAPRIDI